MRLRTGSDVLELKQNHAVAVWFKAVRFHYVPPSFLPAILCSVMAWSSGYRPDILGFILVVAGVTINHFGLNMLDDVCDYMHAVDTCGSPDRNPYTGGSGVLTDGLLAPRQVAAGAAFCFFVTACIGVYLSLTHGWPVLALGLFGVFCSVFYTLPPIKFGYRGLGELALLVNFGPVIGLGAYYVQAATFDLQPLLMSAILGMMMWSMIVINEIPDYEEDKQGGKWNLVARHGRRTGIFLYAAGLAAAYLLLLGSVLSRSATPLALVGFASVPLAINSVIILKGNYLDRKKMSPANLAMIKVHLLTGLALIAAYAVL
jgi:1,4-dihydroxy-2-naphthoate octaprenyltransferase